MVSLIFLLYALFASVFTTAKIALEYTQPLFLVGSRMALAGLLMLAFTYLFKREEFKVQKHQVKRIFILAFFAIYLTNVCEFWGLQYLTSFKTCFIYSLSPFIAAFFSYLIFREKMTGKKWIGMLVGFLGMVPILMSQGSEEHLSGSFSFLSWAEIAVIGAAIFSVYGWIVLRQLIKEDGMTPFMANGSSMLVGGVIALVHSLLVEEWNPVPVTEYMPFLECTVLLIIISNLICYNLYGYLLKRFTATFMSFAGWTTPLFSALFGWFFIGEKVTPPFFISAVIVLLGLFIFYQQELKQGYVSKKGDASAADASSEASPSNATAS